MYLLGSNFDGTTIDPNMWRANMGAAVEKYVSMVEGAPGDKEAVMTFVSKDPPGDAIKSRDESISRDNSISVGQKIGPEYVT